MPEVPERLVPSDGISDYFIELDGIDTPPGHAIVRFRIIRRPPRGEPRTVTTLEFPVGAGGFVSSVADGFDELILALRQMLYVADSLGRAYRSAADRDQG